MARLLLCLCEFISYLCDLNHVILFLCNSLSTRESMPHAQRLLNRLKSPLRYYISTRDGRLRLSRIVGTLVWCVFTSLQRETTITTLFYAVDPNKFKAIPFRAVFPINERVYMFSNLRKYAVVYTFCERVDEMVK